MRKSSGELDVRHTKQSEDKMDEFSMLLLNGNLEGAREFHRKRVEESFNNGVFVGKETVRDSIAKVLGFKTGKE